MHLVICCINVIVLFISLSYPVLLQCHQCSNMPGLLVKWHQRIWLKVTGAKPQHSTTEHNKTFVWGIYCYTCHIWCLKWIFKTQHFLFSNVLSFPQQWVWERCHIVLAFQDLHWLADTAHYFYLEPLDKTLHGLLMLSFLKIWMGTFYRTCCLCMCTKCDYLI